MIDAFWTKWRVRRLCRGDAALVGKWLDDYVGWLYGRLWVQSGHDTAGAEKAIADAFSSAANHLDQWMQHPRPMSEWLLTRIDPKLFPSGIRSRQTPDIQNQARMLWTHSLSETTTLSPELLDVGQQALLLLSRDDQDAMIRRYLRLETSADMAGHCGKTVAEIQGLLYRARHSFRRSLESLTQTASSPPEKSILADQDVLDANLEKLFRSLDPRPMPATESLESLKADIFRILSERGAVDLKLSLRRWAILGVIIVFLGGVGGVFCLYQASRETEQQPDVSPLKKKTKQAVPEKEAPQKVDDKEQTRQALALVEQHDTEGILEILTSGSYPAQLIAAHYLAQFGDESAIDPLDQAAQKWFPDKSSESNPFTDAIVAVEARIRDEQKQEELEKKKQAILEKALPLITKRSPKTEPNAVPAEPNKIPPEPNIPQTAPAIEPNNAVRAEPNAIPSEPNGAPDSNAVIL